MNTRKEHAIQLAKLISTNDDPVKIKELKDHLIPTQSNKTTSRNNHLFYGQGKIGVYKLVEKDGEKFFHKDLSDRIESSLWSDVEVVPPKNKKFRILFLGESVAKGYFFDPYYTPTKALEELLKNYINDLEVIDLARTSLTATLLKEIIVNVDKMDPDLVIFFGGNNWAKDIRNLSDQEAGSISGAINGEISWDRIKEVLDKKSESIVDEVLQSFRKLTNEDKIPVLFMIPEFNLKDWKANKRDQVVTWPLHHPRFVEIRKWLNTLDISDIDQDKLEELKEISIKFPFHPLPFEKIAEYYLQKGQNEFARSYFEKARDTCIYRLSFSPRITSMIAKQISSSFSDRFYVFDYTRIWKYCDVLPDREFYIDYCHLSEKGIIHTVSHIAKFVLDKFFDKSIELNDLLDNCPKADNDVKAGAHFLAAIHNAHLGQTQELVEYHLSRAIQLNQDLSMLIQEYAKAIASNIPRYLTKEFLSINEYRSFKNYLPKLYASPQLLDVPLQSAIMNVINTESHSNEIKKRWEKFYCVKKNRYIDLLTQGQDNLHINPYLLSFYYRSLDDHSKFCFICMSDPVDLILDITCKLPFKTGGDKQGYLYINNELINQFDFGDQWRDISISVKSNVLVIGINHIRMEWQVLEEGLVSKIQLDKYLQEFLNPPFIDIFSLKLSIVS